MSNLVGTGLNQVPTNGMLGGLAYQDPNHASIKDLDLKNLSQINSEIADTAVDVFVYDTRKDSDGGAWRKRTQHTSWYNETLGTATRGSRKEFPAVAVIVVETTKVTIYDGDDPDLPMWMEFEASGGAWNDGVLPAFNAYRAISALNGTICVASTNNSYGLIKIQFISDDAYAHTTSTNYGGYDSLGLSQRNSSGHTFLSGIGAVTLGVLISNYLNDVAMTVLPNAPVDSATGLPIPTIAVATDGGISVIKDDGTVVDITSASGGNYNQSKAITITEENYLWWLGDYNAGSTYLRDSYAVSLDNFPSSDFTWNNSTDNLSDGTSYALTTGSEAGEIKIGSANTWAWNHQERNALGGPAGLAIHKPNIGSETNSLIVAITSSYNTGWMHGNVEGAFLSDTDDTDKTNGQTDPDRSVDNYTLTVTGTITKTAVATGADLVAYSGFTNANYMDNTSYSVNFGNPPTISIVFWQKITDIADYSYALAFSAGTANKGGISNGASSTTYPGQAYFNMGNVTLYTGSRVDDGNWHCLVGTISGTAKKFYLDGKQVSSATISNHDMAGVNKIHVGSFGTTHAYAHRGSLALLRVSKSVPSPEQIKKMYEDEKVLFQENVKATLYGSSDAVTALAYDDTTELLHVGTSAGRSEFQGLRRINNTTTAVTTAISASNDLVAEQ